MRDAIGATLLVGQLVFAMALVPEWSAASLLAPTHVATLLGALTTMRIVELRMRGRRGSADEKIALALFLGGMPFVYLWSGLLDPHPAWIAVELVGIPLFVTMAVLGATRAPWMIAAGIVLHGLLWDLPHLGADRVVPGWYALECFVVDVGLGLYAALETPRFGRKVVRSPA